MVIETVLFCERRAQDEITLVFLCWPDRAMNIGSLFDYRLFVRYLSRLKRQLA